MCTLYSTVHFTLYTAQHLKGQRNCFASIFQLSSGTSSASVLNFLICSIVGPGVVLDLDLDLDLDLVLVLDPVLSGPSGQTRRAVLSADTGT